MNLEKEYKATMVGLHKYMMNKEDPQIKAVLRHQTAKALHSIPKESEAYLTEAETKDLITNDLPKSATWKAKKLKLNIKKMSINWWKTGGRRKLCMVNSPRTCKKIMLIRRCHSNEWNILDSKEKLKDSSQLHKIKHWIPDTTASISSSKDPLTDAECAIPRLRLWSISYLDVKH